jgi:hypothetical protein
MRFTKRPWNLSVCAFGVQVAVGAPYVNEIQNEPPSRALIACTWLVIWSAPSGRHHHIATERLNVNACDVIGQEAELNAQMKTRAAPVTAF